MSHEQTIRAYPDDLSADLAFILGMPNFQCAPIAHALRAGGAEIATRSEAEQAYVMHWFIKLAIDPGVKSKAVLASLFHVAFIYARDLHGCSDIFIEVNPRHRRFYEAMLDFVVECESRPNPRVDAPAVLLRGNTALGTRRIRRP